MSENSTMQEKRCKGCGGQLQFNPETQTLMCASCKEIPEKEAAAMQAALNATLNCPNCGDILEAIIGSRQSKCDSCDSVFAMLNENEECELTGDIPDGNKYIAPFTVSEQDYQKGMISWLANENFTPKDVFEKMAIIRSEGCYVPHYYCIANFKVNWTATIGYDRVETYTIRTKNGVSTATRIVTDWYPFKSTASGKVTNLIEATNEMGKVRTNTQNVNSKAMKKGIRNSSHGLFDGGNFVEIERKHNFDSKYTAGFSVLACDEKSSKAYDKAVIDAGIRNHITSIAPGDRIRNISYSGDIVPEIFLVYRPSWVTLYSYGEKICYSTCDGTNDNRHFGTRPVCKDTKKRVKRWWLGFGLTALIAIIMFFMRDAMAGNDVFGAFLTGSAIVAGGMGLTAMIIHIVSVASGKKALRGQLDKYLANTSAIFGRRSGKADPTLG